MRRTDSCVPKNQRTHWLRSARRVSEGGAQPQKRLCVIPRLYVEVREFASSLRKERMHWDIECSRHWWASFKSRHPDLGTALMAAMESPGSEVPTEKVRSYVAELDHALSAILVPGQRLNMDETRFYSVR
jgi:hypothetical protein